MIQTVSGDLLEQPVDVIVNAWNRNLIPWWLLLARGVSGAIKRKAGFRPFIELGSYGMLPLGGAVLTSAGRLPHLGIIHVAGIGLTWRASEQSIRESVKNALTLAQGRFDSIAFPLIGAGAGGFTSSKAEKIMRDEMERSSYRGRIYIVKRHISRRRPSATPSAPSMPSKNSAHNSNKNSIDVVRPRVRSQQGNRS